MHNNNLFLKVLDSGRLLNTRMTASSTIIDTGLVGSTKMTASSMVLDTGIFWSTMVTASSTVSNVETRNVTVCNKCPRRPLRMTLIPGCDLEHSQGTRVLYRT